MNDYVVESFSKFFIAWKRTETLPPRSLYSRSVVALSLIPTFLPLPCRFSAGSRDKEVRDRI